MVSPRLKEIVARAVLEKEKIESALAKLETDRADLLERIDLIEDPDAQADAAGVLSEIDLRITAQREALDQANLHLAEVQRSQAEVRSANAPSSLGSSSSSSDAVDQALAKVRDHIGALDATAAMSEAPLRKPAEDPKAVLERLKAERSGAAPSPAGDAPKPKSKRTL